MYDGSTKWYSKTYILTTIIRTTPQIHFVMSSSWFWSCNRLINTGSINFIINTHISRRCCHCGGGKVLYHVHLTSVKSFDKPQPYLITVNRLIWYLTLRHYPKTFSKKFPLSTDKFSLHSQMSLVMIVLFTAYGTRSVDEKAYKLTYHYQNFDHLHESVHIFLFKYVNVWRKASRSFWRLYTPAVKSSFRLFISQQFNEWNFRRMWEKSFYIAYVHKIKVNTLMKTKVLKGLKV